MTIDYIAGGRGARAQGERVVALVMLGKHPVVERWALGRIFPNRNKGQAVEGGGNLEPKELEPKLLLELGCSKAAS